MYNCITFLCALVPDKSKPFSTNETMQTTDLLDTAWDNYQVNIFFKI